MVAHSFFSVVVFFFNIFFYFSNLLIMGVSAHDKIGVSNTIYLYYSVQSI